MINKKLIQKEQALKAIQSGDFDKEILTSAKRVVLVLTQDWCPQWQHMQNWLYSVNTDENVDVYELEYNRVDYFNDFMNFKETKLNNHNVPYLRFYKDGVLYRETNYISQGQFKEVISV